METLTAPSAAVDRVSGPAAETRRTGLNLFGFGVLLGAFLLFQLELIAAKHILPWFGGSPAVWTTCMLFFQGVLLAGYAFAHWGATRLAPRVQGKWQLMVIALALTSFALAVLAWGSPLTPAGNLRDVLRGHPVAHILLVLALCVGAPFFLLATTAPVLQHWFRVSAGNESPYRLYALSNIGSFFGLIGYPFLLEWLLPIRRQAWLWNFVFVAFAALYAVLCRRISAQRTGQSSVVEEESQRPGLAKRIMWAALAACGSAMLLATTNLLCEDVVVTPFLWVLPLCLYLLSFILCFDHPRWYQRGVFFLLYGAAIWTALWVFQQGIAVDLIRRSDAYLFILFVICMVSHGELSRSKPAGSHLTSFYLMVSLGGVLGGALVTIVAPRIFNGYWEYHITLVACGLLALWALLADRGSLLYPGVAWKASAIAALLIVVGLGVYQAARQQRLGKLRLRDFFGVKQVYEKEGIRYLHNGGVEHGMQYVDAARRGEGLFYYSRHTALGKLLMNYPQPQGRGRRIGVVGLGTGVVVTYGQPGDTIRFWEIDPQVIQLAKGPDAKFTFLQDTKANVEVIEQDGRLGLQAENGPGYDIVVIDAFSGDAIPTQLVTREAFELYLRRLEGPDSVLICHISNRVVDLTPVMLAFSRTEQIPLRFYMTYNAEYAVFSRNAAMLDLAGPDLRTYRWDEVNSVLWTDDYSSLMSVLRH
jgi:hypothetical protein